MYKPPRFAEMNCAPDQLNTSKPTGAASQLANQLNNPPHYDGATIADMHDNPLYSRHDEIDKIGLAQKKITEAAKAVSKSKFVRQLNREMSKNNIPQK